jgi:RHS repeat-associated protein
VNFIYDSQSRRIAETVGTATKITVYDGWNPIAEYSSPNLQSPISHVRSFTWGIDLSGTMQGAGGVGGLLAVTDSTGTYYPTYDGNGNVSEYLDSTGAVAAHYEYDPFGKTTVATGPKANDFSHRFSTKPLDITTGLYYYAYRYYDPATGRWPSRDPIGERGGVNLYGFVENDGLNVWDYLGQKGSGHHIIPWSLFEGKVSAEVKKFFDSDAARIFNDYYKTHNYGTIRGVKHSEYNKIVKEALDEFLGNQAINDMSLKQAEIFLDKIKKAPANSKIAIFNAGVAQDAADAMKEGLKIAAEKAAKKSIADAVASGAKKSFDAVGKKAGPIGMIVGGGFLINNAQANNVSVIQQFENDMAEEAKFNVIFSPTTVFIVAQGLLSELGAKVCE